MYIYIYMLYVYIIYRLSDVYLCLSIHIYLHIYILYIAFQMYIYLCAYIYINIYMYIYPRRAHNQAHQARGAYKGPAHKGLGWRPMA